LERLYLPGVDVPREDEIVEIGQWQQRGQLAADHFLMDADVKPTLLPPPAPLDGFAPDEFKRRRDALRAAIPQGIILIRGATEDEVPHGSALRYRQNSAFFYLTGVDLFRDFYVIEGRRAGLDQIEIRYYDDPARIEPIAFPEASYTAGLGDNPEWAMDTLRLSYESMVSPASTLGFHCLRSLSCWASYPRCCRVPRACSTARVWSGQRGAGWIDANQLSAHSFAGVSKVAAIWMNRILPIVIDGNIIA
jgi:hypothetical protein